MFTPARLRYSSSPRVRGPPYTVPWRSPGCRRNVPLRSTIHLLWLCCSAIGADEFRFAIGCSSLRHRL
eukprot:11102536-Heterocapsa_arctica.AAC.1